MAGVHHRRSSPRTYSGMSIVYALLIHVLFLSLFLMSFDSSEKEVSSKPKVNIIAAVVVDEAKVQAEINKLRDSEQLRLQQSEARQRKLQQEQQQLAALKKEKVIEQRRLQTQQKQRRIEERKAKKLAEKKKIEQNKLKKLQREQQVLERSRKAEQKRLLALEKKRKAEQKHLAKLEQKRKAEIEKQKKLAQQKKIAQQKKRTQQKREAQQRIEAEAALQKQLAIEQQALTAEQERRMLRELNRYIEIIKQKVTRNWLRPTSAVKGLSCTVAVRLIPGGEVLQARVIKSSGDPVFDRSVESAVLKASPLPLPTDSRMFERFRELKFVFNPEG